MFKEFINNFRNLIFQEQSRLAMEDAQRAHMQAVDNARMTNEQENDIQFLQNQIYQQNMLQDFSDVTNNFDQQLNNLSMNIGGPNMF